MHTLEKIKTTKRTPFRKLSTAAVSLLALSPLAGCDLTDAPSQATVPEGLVVNPGGANPSPTDSIANKIHAALDLQDKIDQKRIDVSTPDGLAALAEAKKVGTFAVEQLRAYGQVRLLGGSTDVPDFSSPNLSSFKLANVRQRIKQIDDPSTRKVVDNMVVAEAQEAVVYGVRFDYIEPGDAEKVLKGSGSDIKGFRKKLEILDAANNAIHNYNDPYTLRDDAKDITDPALKKDLKLVAAGAFADYYSKKAQDGSKAYDRLTKKGEHLEPLMNKLAKAGDKSYEKYRHVLQGERITRTIRGEIKEFNHFDKPASFVGLPKLENPAAPINLREVVGSKLYRDSSETDSYEHQFGEILSDNGKLRLNIFDDSLISLAAKEQLSRLTTDVTPLLEAAFANGDITTVRLVIGKKFNPYFHPLTHEVHMVLPGDNSTSEEQYRQALTHELIHALVSSIFDQKEYATKDEVGRLKEACTALSKQAFSHFEASMRKMPSILDTLVAESDDRYVKGTFKQFKKVIKEGKLLKTLQEMTFSTDDYSEKDADRTDCSGETVNLGAFLEEAALDSLQGIDDEEERFKKRDAVIEKIFASILDDDETTQPSDDLVRLHDVWNDSQTTYSIWAKLNEAAYVDTKYEYKEYLGHSADNPTELMASLGDVSLNNPDEFIAMMRGLSSKDKLTVKKALGATYTVMINRHPTLKPYLYQLRKRYQQT